LAAGDLIVAYFYTGAAKTVTPPSGFAQLRPPVTMTGAASSYRVYSYYKIASGSEGSLSFTWSGSTDHNGLLFAYSGVDSSTPFDVATTSAAGSSSSMTAAGLTTVTPNATLVWAGVDWGEFTGSESATSGFTWRYHGASDLALQDAVQATPGATGSKSVAITSAPWVTFLLALRPADTSSLPSAPGGLAVAGQDHTLNISFDEVAGADSYAVQWRRTDLVPPASTTQSSAPSYLDRMDQTTGTDGTYSYTYDGSDVRIYFINGGIDPSLASNNELDGRTAPGFSLAGTAYDSDPEPHGTQCAVRAVGSVNGVAKGATAVSVNIWGDSSAHLDQFSGASLETCVDWILSDAAGHTAVVDCSYGLAGLQLGGTDDPAVQTQLARLLDAGIPVQIALFNDGNDITSNLTEADPRINWIGYTDTNGTCQSNYADQATIYAPSGFFSSGATAYASGVVAKIKQANPALSPARIKEVLQSQAYDVVTGVTAFNGMLNANSQTSEWSSIDPSNSASLTLDGLDSANYEIRVATVSGGTQSDWSEAVAATTSTTVVEPSGVTLLGAYSFANSSDVGHDDSGNGLDLTILNGTYSAEPALVCAPGPAASVIPFTSEPTDGFTVMTWAKWDSRGNGNVCFFGWWDTSADVGVAAAAVDYGASAMIWTPTSVDSGTASVSINTDHHIALTYASDGSAEMFIDGTSVLTAPGPYVPQLGRTWLFGEDLLTTDAPMYGQFQNSRFYLGVLTPEQITTCMNTDVATAADPLGGGTPVTETNASAEDSITWSGSATARTTMSASSSEDYIWSGEAAAHVNVVAEVATEYKWSGVISARTQMNAASSDSRVWSGDASALTHMKAEADAVYTWSGEAVAGKTAIVMADSIITWSGEASSHVHMKVLVDNVYEWSGEAVVLSDSNAQALVSYVWSGEVVARTHMKAESSDTYAWSGEALAGEVEVASAEATITWSGEAISRTGMDSSSHPEYIWSGEAFSASHYLASVVGQIAWMGLAISDNGEKPTSITVVIKEVERTSSISEIERTVTIGEVPRTISIKEIS